MPKSVISAKKLGGNLPHVVDSWFRPEVLELWKVLRDMYFGVFYDAIQVPRFEFLALFQVLESYHRLKLGGEYMSKGDYEPIRQMLLNAIPASVEQGHRDSLKSRIKYGYQYSLRKRFIVLLDLLDEKLQRLLGIEKRDQQYLGRVFTTRNYYTHYDPEDYALAFQGQELEEANARLAHMIVTLLLKEELGIPEDLITGLLKHRRDTGHLS